MTRQDFELIADTLAGLIADGAHCFDDCDDVSVIVERFAGALAQTNERFDRQRFTQYINKKVDQIQDAELLQERQEGTSFILINDKDEVVAYSGNMSFGDDASIGYVASEAEREALKGPHKIAVVMTGGD